MQGDAPPAGGHGRGSGHHNGGHHHHQQSDQAFQTGPVYDEEEDDFHARTEKVIAFSQHRKFNISSIHPFLFGQAVAMFNAKVVGISHGVGHNRNGEMLCNQNDGWDLIGQKL
jgi:hypothetical protein